MERKSKKGLNEADEQEVPAVFYADGAHQKLCLGTECEDREEDRATCCRAPVCKCEEFVADSFLGEEKKCRYDQQENCDQTQTVCKEGHTLEKVVEVLEYEWHPDWANDNYDKNFIL